MQRESAAGAGGSAAVERTAHAGDRAGRKRAGARSASLSIAVSGDLLPHLPVVARAQAVAGGAKRYDFAPLLRPLRPVVRAADLAFCHVETTLQPGPPAGYPRFRTPPELADAIRATGWDACSVASNHTVDQGQAGVRSTLRALDRAGVAHAGAHRSAAESRRIRLLRAQGLSVALLSYTTSTNGLPVPRPWSVNLAEPRRILSDAARARRRGADVVVVNLHWGTEYRSQPDAAQRRLARRLAGSGDITAIVGQHAHVVQPIRRIRGRWVVFSTGNLLSSQSSACCPAATQDGLVAMLRIRVRAGRARVTQVDYTPTWVRHPDHTVVPVARALRRRWADEALLRASWRRTVATVGRDRGLRPVRLP